MSDFQPSSQELPLPSAASLMRATGIALAIALVLLVFAVLPAEYDIDPTGFGAATGLTALAASQPPIGDFERSEPVADVREDEVVVEVPAFKGVEYKFVLWAGQKMTYSWQSDSGALYYDFHGEPEGDTTGYFESYAVSTASGSKGTFTAPFDGVHGWYWKNTGLSVAKVTLITSGHYEVAGLR